jgi:hypothetical protein
MGWWTTAAFAGTTRLALLVGANDGGAGREPLRHAIADAQAMREVLVELGGVSDLDAVLVSEPGVDALRMALHALDTRAQTLAATGERVEVILYYSGHSDQDSLLMSGGRLPFAELRTRFEGLGAETGLLVLDSCASGAFVRAKGVWSDAAHRASGRAVVTSSSATEASQESDVLGGSFFTLALVSGLRGAADRDGDRRITLTEAYDHAFEATRSATAATAGGTQHPTREVQLVGSGDLVVTDLRSPSAALLLDPELAGTLFVREPGGQLVVEVDKQQGEPMELHLPSGPLTLTLEALDAQYAGEITLMSGASQVLSLEDLEPANVMWTRSRGDAARRQTALWWATGAALGIAAASGGVAMRESGGLPWHVTDTPTSQIASTGFVVSSGLASALLVGAVVGELRRSR